VLYPRAGAVAMPQVEQFNHWYNALAGLLELAFTGSPAAIDLDTDLTILSTSQQVAFYLWLLVYLFFTILSLVLLLNLLIAMLSFTFETVRSESTLQCRTTFAQCLMRLELQATSLRMAVNVGEKKMQGSETRYTYDFRSISSKPVDDLGAERVEGSDNPFAIPDGGPIGRIEDKVAAVNDRLRGEEGHGVNGDVANGPLGRIEAKLDALQARVDQMGHLSLMSGRVL